MFFNINFNENVAKYIKSYKPSKKIIKSNEKLIIEDNEDFVVINKDSGISVQGGTKSKKNLIDIFRDSKIFKNTKPYSVLDLTKIHQVYF